MTDAVSIQNSAREALQQQLSQMEELKQQLEEARQEVIKQKTANRTVREEMRRLQSSIQLMERQRNPGVGYWSAANGKAGKGNESPAESAETPVQERPPAVRSPTPSEVGSSRNEEEEVNLEYLRNVILQFLENKEMRVSLYQASISGRSCSSFIFSAKSRPRTLGHLAIHASRAAAIECKIDVIVYLICSFTNIPSRFLGRSASQRVATDVWQGIVCHVAGHYKSCRSSSLLLVSYLAYTPPLHTCFRVSNFIRSDLCLDSCRSTLDLA